MTTRRPPLGLTSHSDLHDQWLTAIARVNAGNSCGECPAYRTIDEKFTELVRQREEVKASNAMLKRRP